MTIRHSIEAAFSGDGRRARALLFVMFAAINALVLYNAVRHHADIGYDGPGHVKYIGTLAEGRLPTPEDSREFFSPPLPYALPAALMGAGLVDLMGAAKAMQMLNVLCSLVLTFYLLRLAEILRPADVRLKLLALTLLGMLPVYYKTFSQARGEPMLAAAAVVAMHQMVTIFVGGSRRRTDVVLLGLSLTAAVLSRQWGFLLLPALALFAAAQCLKRRTSFRFLVISGAACIALVTIGAGWFYLHLDHQHGGATAFNRDGNDRFAFSNQPASFYFGIGLDRLFESPVRPAFRNRFWPVFYSEMWGDYWCYFLMRGVDTRSGGFVRGSSLERLIKREELPRWLDTNAREMAPYLGRVNLVGLFPTALLVAGLLGGLLAVVRYLRGAPPAPEVATKTFLVLAVVCSLAGYAWFLIKYPNLEKGDTIKATYMLQVYPALALLAADALRHLHDWRPVAFRVCVGLLVVSIAHNLPALFTRFAS